MVVKGRFSKKAPKPQIKLPKNTNPFIDSISALKRKPHQQKATDLLYQIADIVMPIMKEYNFRVKSLIEMSPKSDNLLGLNVNKGGKICLRLRPPRDDDSFLDVEQLVGTMLHELTHNLISPHDARFYKQLDELTVKQEEYIRKGVSGETLLGGFQGKGVRLGEGVKNAKTLKELRDARLKKLNKMYTMGVHKLGGSNPDKGADLKELVRQAAIRRYEDNKWCNSVLAQKENDLPADDDLIIISDSEGVNIGETASSIDLPDNNDKRRATTTPLSGTVSKKAKKDIEVVDLTSD